MNPQKFDETRRPSWTDSPWFWGYVFGTAALLALALAAPKYASRQAQLERRFLARQEGGQTVKGADGQTIDPPTQENLILTLAPLLAICGVLVVVAWSRFWWIHVRAKRKSQIESPHVDHGTTPRD